MDKQEYALEWLTYAERDLNSGKNQKFPLTYSEEMGM
jgi:hypothetical protein